MADAAFYRELIVCSSMSVGEGAGRVAGPVLGPAATPRTPPVDFVVVVASIDADNDRAIAAVIGETNEGGIAPFKPIHLRRATGGYRRIRRGRSIAIAASSAHGCLGVEHGINDLFCLVQRDAIKRCASGSIGGQSGTLRNVALA